MKYAPITAVTLETEVLEQDLNQADKIGKLAVGQQCLYFPGILQTGYVPLSEITWAYMRQEDCQGKLCCGRMNFESFFLMVTTTEKKQKKVNLEKSSEIKAVLALLEERNPKVDIGYSKEKAEKYL